MNGMKNKAMMALPILSLSGLLLSGSVGYGQDTGIQALTHRPAPAQAKGSAQSGGNPHYRVADIFGESDEEKAARLQHEQSQDSSINYARQRVEDMENSLRRLTGQMEQLDHRITELNNRIERTQKDMDYQFCKIATQQLSAPGDDASALPCGSEDSTGGRTAALAPSATPPPATARPAGEPVHLEAPPGTLGTLPAGSGSPPVAAPPPSPNRGKFDAAVKLAARTQYSEARSAFRNFADSYPADELAPQAVYWVGKLAYQEKDYQGAARAFAEEIKKYPDSSQAPDSMLKLAQSLVIMGQKQEGCTALAALPTKYPNASKTIIARAATERKAAGCK
jgi:tol-pal system protein YbgF